LKNDYLVIKGRTIKGRTRDASYIDTKLFKNQVTLSSPHHNSGLNMLIWRQISKKAKY